MNRSILSGRLYCEPYWDSWGCWNYTLAGTKAVIQCPSHQAGFDPTCKHHESRHLLLLRLFFCFSVTATRTCTINGTWWMSPVTNKTWSNYTTCINHDDLAVSIYPNPIRRLFTPNGRMHLQKDKRVIHVFIAGYSVSIVFLIASLFIFTVFK